MPEASHGPRKIPEIAAANRRLYSRMKREFLGDRDERDMDVFYPGCGTDHAVSSVFRQSRCAYLDLEPDCIDALGRTIRQQRPDHRATLNVGDATRGKDLPKHDVDLLLLMYPGFHAQHLLDIVKPGGVAVTAKNDDARVFDAIRDHSDFSLVGTVREELIPECIEMRVRAVMRRLRLKFHKRFSTGKTVVERNRRLLADYSRPATTEEELRETLSLFFGDEHLAHIWHRSRTEYFELIRPETPWISPKIKEIPGLGLYVFRKKSSR